MVSAPTTQTPSSEGADHSRSGTSAGKRAVRAGRRALIDAEDFTRARSVAALARGDSLALDDIARRPNAALAAGVVVALLIAAGAAGSAFLTGRAPAGWRAENTLVLDEATGARYVVLGGLLRPAPTLTAAVLAGAHEKPVLVPHRVVRSASLGRPLPGADLPETVPVVAHRPAPLTACTTPSAALTTTTGATPVGAASSVQVWSGQVTRSSSAADGLLVTATGSSGLLLVTGSSAYPITAGSAEALGYSPAQVRTVPRLWLDLFVRGSALSPVQVPAATGPGSSGAGGIAGIGAAGDVVTVAGSTERLLVAGGQLHPFLNRTSELLAAAPVRQVSGPALAGAPRGDAVGVLDAPSTPPRLPAREDAVVGCVSAGGGLTVASQVSAPALLAAPAQEVSVAGVTTRVVWHSRPGSGALVGPAGVDRPSSDDTTIAGDPTSTHGARIVVAGTAYPVADRRTMTALGLDPRQARVLSDPWLALTVSGPSLHARR